MVHFIVVPVNQKQFSQNNRSHRITLYGKYYLSIVFPTALCCCACLCFRLCVNRIYSNPKTDFVFFWRGGGRTFTIQYKKYTVWDLVHTYSCLSNTVNRFCVAKVLGKWQISNQIFIKKKCNSRSK